MDAGHPARRGSRGRDPGRNATTCSPEGQGPRTTSEFRETGTESPAGNLVLTTAASAREFAGRRPAGSDCSAALPIVETRDALKSEEADSSDDKLIA